MTMSYFSRSWGSISTWKFAIFACKHYDSTNISRIGPKLIPWMYIRSVLVKFENGWRWHIFRGHGSRLHENLHDNSTNISHIEPKLIPWMYPRSVLVKFKDGWSWPIIRGHGGRFQHANLKFFACKHDNSINISCIVPKLIPWMYFKSVLDKFEDLWPWPIFQGHDVNFNMVICMAITSNPPITLCATFVHCLSIFCQMLRKNPGGCN